MKLNIQMFASTNKTANYELPQFVGTDKPTWLGDINEAMSDIDAGMHENASDIASMASDVASATAAASQASQDVSTLTTTVNTLSGTVTSVQTTANNASQTASSALNTANSANGKADTNATNIATNASDIADINTELALLEPVVLYEGAGNTGLLDNIPLSESSANFEFIEIFCGKTKPESSTKIEVSKSNTATLFDYTDLGTVPQLTWKKVQINTNTITSQGGYYMNYTSNGVGTGKTDEIYIYKVIGYKE